MTEITSAGSMPAPQSQGFIERVGPMPSWREAGRILVISAQLLLLFLLLRQLQIEPGTGLTKILPLVFVGFLVHSVLPLHWRPPFFVALSVSAILLVLGIVPGLILLTLGLTLIGVCHLPVAYSTRVLLLVVIAGALASVRAGWISISPGLLKSMSMPALPRVVLPVLGSMFMFRLIIYIYDMRHEEEARAKGGRAAASLPKPATVWTALSYFFLLPNVCFLLFPIVDYRTYRRTYYDKPAPAIYQKGVWWICLGLIYLMLYRVVYHYLVPSPEDVQGLPGIARFMTASYLVYLRVVGQFHLITGLLCLFGLNLPPAHRFYLLASSFTDFWRRARIEWKDFMVKIFYYPMLVPLQRRLGATPALILATVGVFIATWLLHSYQWFWLRGDFRLSGSDGVFWTLIGSCVLVNSLLEARKAKAKSKGWSTGDATVHALKVMGMFIFMCVLWSYWSSPSVAIWLSYLTAARDSSATQYAVLIAILLVILAAGVLAQYVAFRMTPPKTLAVKGQAPRQSRLPSASLWQPAVVFAVAAFLLVFQLPTTRQAFGEPASLVVATLSSNTLNAVDQEREDRGYYEVLLDEPHSTVTLAAGGADLTEGAAAAHAPATGEAAKTAGPGDDDVEGGIDDGAASGSVPGTAASSARGASTSTSAAPASPKADTGASKPVAAVVTPATSSAGSKNVELAPRKIAPVVPADTAARPAARAAAKRQTAPLADSNPAPSAAAGATGPINRKVVGRRLRTYERMTDDMRMWENAPNYTGSFKGAPVITNRWGMRDKDYSLKRPPQTYRIALLGSSMTVGAGVPIEQTMETLLEDRLNREGPGAPRRKYEILNFSVGAYSIFQNVAVVDKQVFAFSPNAVMVGVFSVDGGRMSEFLQKLVRSGLPIPYPYVRAKLAEAGVKPDMEQPELLRRLAPISEDLVRWSYAHIVEVCRQHGVTAVGVVLPEPRSLPGHNIDQSARLAQAAGLPVIDLRGMYQGQPIDSLSLSEQGDPHWNARGHKFVADHLFDLMRQSDNRTFKLGFQ